MIKPTQDINHLIAQKTSINVEDLKTTLSFITSFWSIEPDLLEVVKVWKMKQTSPTVYDWWEILVYNPKGDENEEYYLLYEILEWGVDSRDSVDLIEGDSNPTQTIFKLDNCTVELLFENDAHD